MIVVRLQGGLGNQMFQYAYSRELAARGRSVRLEAGSFAEDPQRDYALDAWRVDPAFASAETTRRLPLQYGGSGWRGWLTGRAPLRHVRERTMGFRERFLNPPESAYLDGYWQSERFFPSVRDELLATFRPRQAVTPESNQLAGRIERTNAIALHVRRGDYQNLPFMQVCDTAYYQRAVDDLLARHTGLQAFVFSDDPEWCGKNLRLPCPTHFVTHTTGATAHEDLWLISRCRRHIIANSSFSWWGAWLKEDPTGEIYAPRLWSHSKRVNSPDIVPDRWITDSYPASRAAA